MRNQTFGLIRNILFAGLASLVLTISFAHAAPIVRSAPSENEFVIRRAASPVFSATETTPVLLVSQGFLSSVFAFLAFSIIFFLSVVLPLLFIVPTILTWRRNKHLRRHGTAARAKISKIWDTGVSLNADPQVGLRMIIFADDRPPFQAETKSIVSRLQIPLVQVGSMVEVRYDRQDVSKVALVI